MRMRRAVLGLVAASLMSASVTAPAAGSELPEGNRGIEDTAPVRRLGNLRYGPPTNSPTYGLGLWGWAEKGLLYQLRQTGSGTYDQLVSLDMATGDVQGILPLSPPAWGPNPTAETSTAAGRDHVAVLDREGGRLFVAYGARPQSPTPGETPCPNATVGCVAGVYVIDAQTLSPRGRMRMDLPTVEGARVSAIPRALTFAQAEPELGWADQVLMVVEETGHGPLENSVVPSASTEVQRTTPKRNSANIAYAVAFDPATMRQEWAVRLEGCRNSREARDWYKTGEGNPAAIFRTGGAEPALYVGCHGNASLQGTVVRVPLDGEGRPATVPATTSTPSASVDEDPDPAGVVTPAPRQETFAGPDKVNVILADPVSRRILMRVTDLGEVWWVFDGVANQFIGTVGIGNYGHGHTSYGLDPDIGRLYVIAAKPTESHYTGPGGLYLADIRRNPLSQALHYSHLADPPRKGEGLAGASAQSMPVLNVVPRGSGSATTLYQNSVGDPTHTLAVLVDEMAVTEDAPVQAGTVRSLDLDEAPGVTAATFDGTARGFGFRTILIGGAEGAARVGPADPIGVVRGLPELDGTRNSSVNTGSVGDFLNGRSPGAGNAVPREPVVFGIGPAGDVLREVLPAPDACTDAQRELVLAFVGPRSSAVVDASSSRGETQSVVVDTRTREDLTAPVSRCARKDWKALWEAALVSSPPMEEPGVEWPFEDGVSSCTATDEDETSAWSDPVAGMFASRVECGEQQVEGWGQARGVQLEGVSVAHTLSSFRIYRDTERGIVARVESIARGVNVGGVVKIDTVRGAAESWANGRHGTADPAEPAGPDTFNPYNCDFTRPAGSCFQRHIFGVTVAKPEGGVAYRCGPCGPEDDFIDAMNRGLGAFGYARFRQPSRELARGSDDGFVAAITKPDKERFADIVLNNDLLETMVPMLEVVRYATHGRPAADGSVQYRMGTPPRGRQVYQFAAVEVSSSYGIQCLLVYDEATNTCAASKEEPGSIAVSLTDADGKALAGGAFEVRTDADTDGVVGLKDALIPDGACVTTDDGVGTCKFDALQPGSYLVSQVAAPPGYGKVAEPFVVELASGEARTVTFQNTSNVSTIAVSAADEAGKPVSGAQFAVYPDADSDGKVAADAQPAATCTTDASGSCSMQVPAGSYVLVQSSAPGGLEPIEPVAFTFASGGQTAAVGVVNYPAGGVPPVEPAASPVEYSAPPASVVTETVTDYTPTAEVADVPQVSIPQAVGGTIVRVIQAPGDALRLLSRDPKQAVAWTASLMLFALALMAVRRRQQAIELIQE